MINRRIARLFDEDGIVPVIEVTEGAVLHGYDALLMEMEENPTDVIGVMIDILAKSKQEVARLRTDLWLSELGYSQPLDYSNNWDDYQPPFGLFGPN